MAERMHEASCLLGDEHVSSGSASFELSDLVRILAMLAQLSWGLPQTLVGFVIFLAHLFRPHKLYRACIVTEWDMGAGISLGLFVFVPRSASRALVAHEYGHCLQSLIIGPAYLPLVAVPSLIWAGLPSLEKRRQTKGKSYYSFITERSANALAKAICKTMPEGGRDV